MKDLLMLSVRCFVFNHEPFLRQCLDGFVMQKTNFRFEAIVHDDASTDGSADIIREYAAKYPDIIKPIIETENQYSKKDGSLTRIMNTHTHGKYIAICEGDDYWTDPLKLQKQVDFLEENPEYGLIYTQVEAFDSNGVVGPFAFEVKDAKSLLYGNGIATLSTCFRRELLMRYLDEVNPYDKNWLMGDYPMWLWFLLHTKAYFLDDVTARYRILQNSASHSTNIEKVVAFEKSVLDVKLFYIEKYWNGDRILLKDVYTKSIWYILRLYIVNDKDKEAFDVFFENFNFLKFKQKFYGLVLWIFPFVKGYIKKQWSKYTSVFK